MEITTESKSDEEAIDMDVDNPPFGGGNGNYHLTKLAAGANIYLPPTPSIFACLLRSPLPCLPRGGFTLSAALASTTSHPGALSFSGVTTVTSAMSREEGEGALPNLAPVGIGTEQLIQSAQEVDNEQAVTGAPKFDKIGEKQVTNEMEGNMKNQAGNIQEKGSSIAVCEAPSIVEQVDGVEQVNSSIPLAGSSKKKGLGERISVYSRKTIEEMGWEEYEKRSDEVVDKDISVFWDRIQLVEETQGEKGGGGGVISGENGEEGECEGEEEECENEGYLESSNAWIDELEELTGVKWVNGVLMEIKSYMDVVYDNEQRIHVEDVDAMALKTCIILMEMDKADPSGGCLGPDTKFGCQLRANQERLGGKLCRWAWRAYGPGYDE
nr:hypothetical protein Itr_chr05CG17290 [Ipomoea trifida]